MESDQVLTIDAGQGIDLEYEIAGVGSRAYAFTIDWHIRVLLATGWALIGLLLQVFLGMTSMLVAIPAVAIYLLYHPVVELMSNGSTPGKKKAGVRVVTLDGMAPTAMQVLIRNLFRILDSLPMFYGVGIVACVSNKSSQRLGDMVAGTLLVYDEEAPNITDAVGALAAGSLDISQANAVRKLLDRWPELDEDVQVALARRLLSKLGVASSSNNADRLQRELKRLLAQDGGTP